MMMEWWSSSRQRNGRSKRRTEPRTPITGKRQWLGSCICDLAHVQLPEVAMRSSVSARGARERVRWSGVLRRSVAGAAIALLSTTAIGACASGHSHRGADQQIIVHLTNDLAPPSDVTVYAVTQDGTRQTSRRCATEQGSGVEGADGHLTGSDLSNRGGAHRRTTRSCRSRSPSTSALSMIDWDLQTNAMWFPETGE